MYANSTNMDIVNLETSVEKNIVLRNVVVYPVKEKSLDVDLDIPYNVDIFQPTDNASLVITALMSMNYSLPEQLQKVNLLRIKPKI